ncbi:MAG: hypothetical protein EB101_03795 [Chitinophagia bacterium]|nr:hypothetical protein [Chitinophagia bacterium]
MVAFWAFVESFLGGILHALQVPLRGIVLAGAATACLTTIAAVTGGYVEKKPTRNFSVDLLNATLAVMAVKLILSPQSPLTAYVAMLFQGGLAYLLFGCLPSFRLAAILFSVLALVETALQKVLVLYLFFGADFWTTVAAWVNDLHVQFGFLPLGLRGIVMAYLLLYFIVGLAIGYWFGFWPDRIKKKKDSLLLAYQQEKQSTPAAVASPRYSRFRFWLFFLLVALAISLFVLPYSLLMTTLVRVLVFSLAVYFLTPPLLRWLTRLLSATIQQHVTLRLIDSMQEQKLIFYFCWQRFAGRGVLLRLLLAFEAALILSAAKAEVALPST